MSWIRSGLIIKIGTENMSWIVSGESNDCSCIWNRTENEVKLNWKYGLKLNGEIDSNQKWLFESEKVS